MDSETQLPTPSIWYRFEENASEIKNYGTGVFDATIYNGASAGPNVSPKGTASLSLRNIPPKKSEDDTGQYLSIPPFTTGGPMTISLWFKKEMKGEDFARIFDFSDGQNLDNTFLLTFTKNGNLWIRSHGSTYIISETDYCDNKWHHVVLIIDKSNLTVYIDTEVIQKIPYFNVPITVRDKNYIGRSSFRGDDYCTMNIADFRKYTQVLTVNDVLILFNYYKILYFSNSLSENDTSNSLNNRMKIFNEIYTKQQKNSVLHYFIIIVLPVVLFFIISLILYFG